MSMYVCITILFLPLHICIHIYEHYIYTSICRSINMYTYIYAHVRL